MTITPKEKSFSGRIDLPTMRAKKLLETFQPTISEKQFAKRVYLEYSDSDRLAIHISALVLGIH
jgi:hypothetical protein